MGNRNNDRELPTIINALAYSQISIERLAKQIQKGQFLVAKEELQNLANNLGIVTNYVQASIKEKLNYKEGEKGLNK